MPRLKAEEFEQIYFNFDSAISRYDCGTKCAPHNNGVPVCCSTQHAIPVVFVQEWQYLKERTELWHLYRPKSAHERKIKEELPNSARLVECRGAAYCEREHRSLSCRTFPFFPYLNREGQFIGLSYYWNFEDRCWVISNLQIVEPAFVREFVKTYELLFEREPDEREAFVSQSASMRRVFSRWKRMIPLIHRDGAYFLISPRTGRMRKVDPARMPKHGPFVVAPSGADRSPQENLKS